MTYQEIVEHIAKALNGHPDYVLRTIDIRRYSTGTTHLKAVVPKRRLSSRPTVCIIATLHGEEPAGAVACAMHICEIVEAAHNAKVNLFLVPCANPYGFDRGVRTTPASEATNGGYAHPGLGKPDDEVKRFRKFLRQTHAEYFLDLHEDYESHGAYVYAFSDRGIANALLKAVSRILPIEKKPVMDDPDIMDADIHNGVVFEAHDGSSEDFMSHTPRMRFSGALETPSSFYPIKIRASAHAAAVQALIRIAGQPLKKSVHHRVVHRIIGLTRLFWTR